MTRPLAWPAGSWRSSSGGCYLPQRSDPAATRIGGTLLARATLDTYAERRPFRRMGGARTVGQRHAHLFPPSAVIAMLAALTQLLAKKGVQLIGHKMIPLLCYRKITNIPVSISTWQRKCTPPSTTAYTVVAINWTPTLATRGK